VARVVPDAYEPRWGNPKLLGNAFLMRWFLVIVSKGVLVPKMAQVSDARKMRNRASRLLDLATRTRCEGRPDFAALLTDLATEILEHARDIEHRDESGDVSRSTSNKSSRQDAA
jgi:hypothetical protein